MKELIRQKAAELGFDACRFATADPPDHGADFERWLEDGNHGEMNYLQRNAAKRVDPKEILPGAETMIALSVSYARPGNDDRTDASERAQLPEASRRNGLIARYARYRDYHHVAGERLQKLAGYTGELGGAGTKSLCYVDTGPVLERDLAQRAGVGFVGKHNNVISRTHGNWIFLCEIITTLRLEPDLPEKNRCGSCTRCMDVCPTRAIRAPFQLDSRRCISYLTIELKGPIPVEFRSAIGNRIYGCDDCLAVCPWNRFAAAGRLMGEHAREDLAAPDMVELLSLDEAGFRQRFSGTPIVRVKRRGLLRNVCVGLGNCGGESALPALHGAASDPDPLIAEHACWAMRQIEQRSERSISSPDTSDVAR